MYGTQSQYDNMAGECRRRRTEMQALGMCRIVVEDGKVTEVGEPRLKYCPLFNKLLGVRIWSTA